MDKKFDLNTFGKVYGIIAMAVVIGLSYLQNPDSDSAFILGSMAGGIIATIGIPYAIALIVWRISRRKDGAGSLVFIVLVTIFLLGQVAQMANTAQNSIAFKELLAENESTKTAFRDGMQEGNSPEERVEHYDQFVQSTTSSIKQAALNTTGSEQQLFESLSRFIEKTQALQKTWSDSFDVFQSDQVLNLHTLKSDESYREQIALTADYRAKTLAYKNTDFLKLLRKELANIPDREIAEEAMKGAKKKLDTQAVYMQPLMTTHLEYADSITQLMTLLHDNPDAWVYENEEIEFNDSRIEKQFDDSFDQIMQIEEKINTLSNQLLQTI